MKISQLPEPYNRMAESNRVNESDDVNSAFHWERTKQGHDFWSEVHKAKTIIDLPIIIKK